MPRSRPTSPDLCGYQFKDPGLLNEALTHPSLSGKFNYQRLEFLGDRVIGLVIADWLLEKFPGEAEGKLNRRFTQLVRKETLAEVCLEMGVKERIRMTPSADSDGTRNKVAILGDICEALIGAVYTDGGIDAARDLIRSYWENRIDAGSVELRDSKTLLQEWAQARGIAIPEYEMVERSGLDHSPIFTIEVRLGNGKTATGNGSSKRAGEQEAAGALLRQLKKETK